MNPTVVDHAIIAHSLHYLRAEDTETALFRHYCHQVTLPLLIEATRNLPRKAARADTPLESVETELLAAQPLWVPILRAGLGMLKVAVDLFPDSPVGHIGLERDEETAVARSYYEKLPAATGQPIFILDPMLATGGSAISAVQRIKQLSPQSSIALVCIVAAPEGIECLKSQHPDVTIYTAAIDRELNDVKFILPGLGDFGDRYFGTVES